MDKIIEALQESSKVGMARCNEKQCRECAVAILGVAYHHPVGGINKANDKLNKIASVVDATLLATRMQMNQGPEVMISGSRFIEAKRLEDVMTHIARLLVE